MNRLGATPTPIWDTFCDLAASALPAPRFRFNGRVYRVRKAGARAIALMQDVAQAERLGVSMLPRKPKIRELQQVTPPALLCFLIQETRSEYQLRLAIWLLGKYGRSGVKRSVFQHWMHPSLKVRLEVIRSLKRLAAWQCLRIISQASTCKTTKTVAQRTLNWHLGRESFAQRLAGYLETVSPLALEIGRIDDESDLVVADDVQLSDDGLPKDRWSIRLVLGKIRSLVTLSRRRRGSWLDWPH